MDIPTRSEVNRHLYPEPIQGMEIPSFSFLLILDNAEDVKKFQELRAVEGIVLKAVSENVLLCFSSESHEPTGRLLKTYARPDYKFSLVQLGEKRDF